MTNPRKMHATNKGKLRKVMQDARKRRPHARHVKFTPAEKSTLREVMTDHARNVRKRSKSSATHRRKSTTHRRRRGIATRHSRPLVGRKPGFKHSAATRKKMSAAHKARWRKHAPRYKRERRHK